VTLQQTNPRLILASASAARAALLRGAGLTFESLPTRVDEAAIKQAARAEGMSAAETALCLAEQKANRLSVRYPDALVIGADQLLVRGEDWFDKPPDLDAARTQLRALRGRAHVLVTAVACLRDGARLWHHVAQPRLTMRPFSDAMLETYLAEEQTHVTGCVGAYRLEGPGAQLFDAVEGDYFSILGLPLLPLLGFLRQHGVLFS
jgi:septum formation protein